MDFSLPRKIYIVKYSSILNAILSKIIARFNTITAIKSEGTFSSGTKNSFCSNIKKIVSLVTGEYI